MRFENTEVFGFKAALRGMRNPYDSWDKSDSIIDIPNNDVTIEHIVIGPNDMELAQKLIHGGAPHFKFLRQIAVWVDIDAPLYWWSEADTYKVGTVADSCSTMHMLGKKPFDETMFETRYMDAAEIAEILVKLNKVQEEYIHYRDNKDNAGIQLCHRKLKALLPTSYLQKRTWSANYAILRNMYFWRKGHRLSEWNTDFVEWVKTLPYAEEFILFEN